MKEVLKNNGYRELVSQISETFVHGQQKAVHAVNSCLAETYWKIGQYIVMRQFYLTFPIFAELPQKLSWTHFVELLKIDDPLERSFYLPSKEELKRIIEKSNDTEIRNHQN